MLEFIHAILVVLVPAAHPAADAGIAPAQVPANREANVWDDEDPGERKRILYLHGGRPLRAVAREREGHWEVRSTGNEWHALPRGAVARAALERDVLRLLDKHRASLAESEVPAARAGLAQWMIANGLVREAFEHLDALLEDRPHDEHALALLRRRDLVALPNLEVPAEERAAARATLSVWGAQRGLAARELAIAELGRVTDRETLGAELALELGHSSPRRRSFAAQAIGRLLPGERLKALCTHAVLDRSTEVRHHASRALGASGSTAVLAPLVRALGSERGRVQLQAAEALGQVGLAAGVEPLMGALAAAARRGTGAGRVPHAHLFIGSQVSYVQDFDVEVALAAAVADPQINTLIEGAVLDVGVISVSEISFATHSRVIRTSLERLTGERPGRTARAWEEWWRRNRSPWQARLRPPVTDAR